MVNEVKDLMESTESSPLHYESCTIEVNPPSINAKFVCKSVAGDETREIALLSPVTPATNNQTLTNENEMKQVTRRSPRNKKPIADVDSSQIELKTSIAFIQQDEENHKLEDTATNGTMKSQIVHDQMNVQKSFEENHSFSNEENQYDEFNDRNSTSGEDIDALVALSKDGTTNPAISLITNVVDNSIKSAKVFSSKILFHSDKILEGCANTLLELRSLSDAREANRRAVKELSKKKSENECHCRAASTMMPIHKNITTENVQSLDKLDHAIENSTDRVLCKLEASLSCIQEFARMLTTSVTEGEARLVNEVTVPLPVLDCLAASMEAMASQHNSTSHKYTLSQIRKLEQWYTQCPRPNESELSTMLQILSLPPYSDTSVEEDLVAKKCIRKWFKKRRIQERHEFLKASQDPSTNEIKLDKLQPLVQQFNGIIENRMLEARKQSEKDCILPEYDQLLIDTPPTTKKRTYEEISMSKTENSRQIEPKRGAADVITDPEIVKVASKLEIIAIQRKLRRSLLSKDAIYKEDVLEVVSLLRCLDIPKSILAETDLIEDVRNILRIYRNIPEIREIGGVVLQNLNVMIGRASNNKKSTSEGDSKVALETPTKSKSGRNNGNPGNESGDRSRPLKFTMKQVEELEKWFQSNNKPSTPELEEFLRRLNEPPLREEKQQPIGVTMLQLRRWFNKRRCLRRPPLSLAAHQAETQNKTKKTRHDEPENENEMHEPEMEQSTEHEINNTLEDKKNHTTEISEEIQVETTPMEIEITEATSTKRIFSDSSDTEIDE